MRNAKNQKFPFKLVDIWRKTPFGDLSISFMKISLDKNSMATYTISANVVTISTLNVTQEKQNKKEIPSFGLQKGLMV